MVIAGIDSGEVAVQYDDRVPPGTSALACEVVIGVAIDVEGGG